MKKFALKSIAVEAEDYENETDMWVFGAAGAAVLLGIRAKKANNNIAIIGNGLSARSRQTTFRNSRSNAQAHRAKQN